MDKNKEMDELIRIQRVERVRRLSAVLFGLTQGLLLFYGFFQGQGYFQGLGLGLLVGLLLGLLEGLLQRMGLWLGLLLGLLLVLGLGLGFLKWLGLSLVLGLVLGLGPGLGLNRLFSKQSLSTSKLDRLYSLFPEEQRNDITTRLRRLKKKGKPQWFLRLKAIHYWLELLRATIQIWWENLWLPRNRNIDK